MHTKIVEITPKKEKEFHYNRFFEQVCGGGEVLERCVHFRDNFFLLTPSLSR